MIAIRAVRAVLALCLVAPLAVPFAGCGAPAAPAEDEVSDVLSFHDEGLLGNGLTRAQIQTVLKLIDDICGDTWCEGDYNFRFRSLFCDPGSGTCSLALQMLPREGGRTPPLARWHVCRTSGFVDFDSLVNTTSSGYQSLTSTYYEALSVCIAGLEGAES